jgi:hypothetical protein
MQNSSMHIVDEVEAFGVELFKNLTLEFCEDVSNAL